MIGGGLSIGANIPVPEVLRPMAPASLVMSAIANDTASCDVGWIAAWVLILTTCGVETCE